MTEEIFHDEIHLLEAKSKRYMMRLISWPKKSLLMWMNNLNVDEIKLDDECSKESTLNESIKKFVDKTTGTTDRKSTRLNSSHLPSSRMPSSA